MFPSWFESGLKACEKRSETKVQKRKRERRGGSPGHTDVWFEGCEPKPGKTQEDHFPEGENPREKVDPPNTQEREKQPSKPERHRERPNAREKRQKAGREERDCVGDAQSWPRGRSGKATGKVGVGEEKEAGKAEEDRGEAARWKRGRSAERG